MTEERGQKTDEQLASEVGAHLRRLESDISGEAQAKLSTARMRALGGAQRSGRGPLNSWVWTGAAAFGVMTIATLLFLRSPELEQMPDLDAGEFLVAQEAELLEDLEFAAWIASLEESGESDVPIQG